MQRSLLLVLLQNIAWRAATFGRALLLVRKIYTKQVLSLRWVPVFEKEVWAAVSHQICDVTICKYRIVFY